MLEYQNTNEFLGARVDYTATPLILVNPHRLIAVLKGMIKSTGSRKNRPIAVSLNYLEREACAVLQLQAPGIRVAFSAQPWDSYQD